MKTIESKINRNYIISSVLLIDFKIYLNKFDFVKRILRYDCKKWIKQNYTE